MGETAVGPHDFRWKGCRWWICRACYHPAGAHPRLGWSRARPLHDNRQGDPDA